MKQLSILFLTGLVVAACSFDRINFVEVPVVDKGANNKTGFGKNGIDFAWIKTNIFQPNRCLQCHGEGKSLDLSSYAKAIAAVDRNGKKLVVVGDYTNSKLYNEVESGRMPRGGPKVSEDLIYALAVWINMGAVEGVAEKDEPKVDEPKEINELNFDFIKTKIFDPKCNHCHGPDGEAFYVDLTTREATLKKVNLLDPKNSRIYKAVFSGRMPQNEPRLADEEIALILKWIETGAK